MTLMEGLTEFQLLVARTFLRVPEAHTPHLTEVCL